ncbi:MAG: hypothetical protein ACYC96_14000 [Fimbriimonadaceae bacterium]
MKPLQTDERLPPGSVKPPTDADAAMLGGCAVFLTVALLAFGVAVWPHLAYPAAYRVTTLRTCLLMGLGPAAVVGAVGARQGGLAGACGFVSGALITSVFLFLRLQQVFVTSGVRSGPIPNYSPAAIYLLPLGWFVLALAIAAVAMPRIRYRGLGAEKLEVK